MSSQKIPDNDDVELPTVGASSAPLPDEHVSDFRKPRVTPASENPATDSTESGDAGEEEDEPLTPDETLYFKLSTNYSRFLSRQGEILRLALYVKERADEIDDAKSRAKEVIGKRLSEVDDSALQSIWDTVIPFVEDTIDDRLSEEERMEAVSKALDEVAATLPEGAMSSYIQGVARVNFTPPAVPMLFSSLLVSLVGELETLVAGVARALFESRPEALDGSGRTFTWSEVAKFNDLDAFRTHAIDRAVEGMLHGSLDDWLGYLEQKFGVTRPKLATTYLAAEIVQRRHVIVHAGGTASRQYLESLSSFKHSTALDDDLPVDHGYLLQAADTLLVIALGLTTAAGFKLCSEPDIVRSLESDIANGCFFLLQERRFHAVKTIVSHVPLDRMKNESPRLITRVNGWIAQKKLGEFDSIRKAVEDFDVSSRSNDLVLAKLCLLDQLEEADELAQKMLQTDELKPEFWITWPLLDDVREHHRTKLENEALTTPVEGLSA